MLKNIFTVALANIANFGSSFIVGFILPSVLTVAAYGHYKEYTLYMSFVYLLNFGFNDGIYIKYGGKKLDELSISKLLEEYNFVRIFQFLMFIPVLLFGIINKNPTLIVFSFSTYFVNIITFNNNFYQAIGEFKLFSSANILKSIIYIGALLFGVFILRSDSYVVYIILSSASFGFIYLYYEYFFHKQFGISFKVNVIDQLSLFKVGIFILLANMSLTFVGNVGNWIVNIGFSIEDFANYSFQNSILNVILLIVNSVGMVFFNIISKKEDQDLLKFTKKICIFLGIFGGLGYFAFEIIIRVFFVQYIRALSLLSVTFISLPYIMISKIIIANLYKSRKNEKKYLVDSVSFAIFSFVFIYLLYLIFDNMLVVAIGTTINYILWFLYTSRVEYRYLKSDLKEILLLLSHIIIFYIAANNVPLSVGIGIYLMYCIVIIFIFREDFLKILSYVK